MFHDDFKKKLLTVILMSLALLNLKSTHCQAATSYYVSPNGCDSNPGTIKKPFKSVHQAKSTVREQITKGQKGDITVYLRGGQYVLDKTVTFGLEDSGKKLLIDCGLFQGIKSNRQKNWDPFPIPPSEIDSILLTHAHLDHSGYIPRFCNQGFQGKIQSVFHGDALG